MRPKRHLLLPRPGARARRAVLGLLALLATGSVLTACSSSSGGGSKTLVLYNGQHPQTTDALVAAFEKATGIKVDVRSDDEDVLSDQIVQEGSHSPADVIYTENSPALEYLQDKGLLAPVDKSTLDQVASKYDSPQHEWVGVSARVSVLVYNTTMLKPSELPTSILALAEPKWKGKLAIAPQETDFQPIVTAVARAYGTKEALSWLRGIKANGAAHEYQDNETITSAVNSGQAEIGVINHYYWYRLRAEIGASSMHSAIAYFAPHNPGYVIDISGAAVLKSAANPKAAEQFLAFLVSKKGQEIIAHSDSFEYPIAHHVAAHSGLRPLSSMQPYPITLGQLGNGQTAVSLMEKVQLLP